MAVVGGLPRVDRTLMVSLLISHSSYKVWVAQPRSWELEGKKNPIIPLEGPGRWDPGVEVCWAQGLS